MALITSPQSVRVVYGGPPIALSKADWPKFFESISRFDKGVELFWRSAPGSRNKLLAVAPGDILELKPLAKLPRDGVVVPTDDGADPTESAVQTVLLSTTGQVVASDTIFAPAP